MKMLITFVLATGLASVSWARTTYETGRGQEFGYCSYSQGFFCLSNIKSRAESEAKRQADWECQMKQGTSRSYTANCNTTCFPNILSPGDQNVPVRCSSTCTVQCEINN